MFRKTFTFLILLVIASSCSKDETVDYGPIDQKIIEDYLTANNLTSQITSSGLHYIIAKPGDPNRMPKSNSKVTADYRGYLTTGEVFDETYSKGKPADFALDGVVKGWQEGLQLIGLNGKIKLLIPSKLGYAANPPSGSIIPLNAVLIFDVELKDIY
jgi:FKBP-type peptidyl-prolyl cis-trans isomerase FkpA